MARVEAAGHVRGDGKGRGGGIGVLMAELEAAGHVSGDGKGRGWALSVGKELESAGHVRVGKSSPQPSGAEGGNVRYALIYPPLAAGEYKRRDTCAEMARVEAAGHVRGDGKGRGGGTRARRWLGREAAGHVRVGKSSPQPSGAEGGNVRYALIYPPLAAGEYKRRDT